MNDSVAEDVLRLYEDNGLSIDEICLELSDMSLEPLAVKALLSAKSGLYRATVKANQTTGLVVTNEDHQLLIESLKTIALGGENENARVKAAIYLHEELTGRNQKRINALKDNSRIGGAALIANGLVALSDKLRRAREIRDKVMSGELRAKEERLTVNV